MAPTGSLIPAEIDLDAVMGGDFSATINLYQDEAQTQAFDLTGYIVTVTVGSLVLTSGSGLSVVAATGTIVMTMTAVQTSELSPGDWHYFLKLVDGEDVVSFPLDGTVHVKVP